MKNIRTLATEYIAISKTTDAVMRMVTGQLEALDVDPGEVYQLAPLRMEFAAMLLDIVAETYTVEELETAIAFSLSPIGLSMRAKQADVERLTAERMPAILERCAQP